MSRSKDGIFRAMKLELTHVKETKMNILLLFVLPVVMVITFAIASDIKIPFEIPGMNNLGYETFYDYFAPGILSTIVIFMAMQLTILRIVAERAPYGTLDRELLAISRSDMFFGKLVANMLISFIQVLIIFVIGVFVFKFHMAGEPIYFLLILLLTSLIGLSIGLFFSVFSNTKEQAIQLVPFAVLVFIVLSGYIIPLDFMPANIRMIASNTPLSLSYQSLNNISINGSPISNLIGEIIKILLWFFFFTFAGLIKFMMEKR